MLERKGERLERLRRIREEEMELDTEIQQLVSFQIAIRTTVHVPLMTIDVLD